MRRRIAVVTGTRAEYGHLYWLLRAIESDPRLKLQLVVTGMHLSSRFGRTVTAIRSDGFRPAAEIPFDLSSDRPECLAAASGRSIGDFAEAFRQLKPELLVLLGDRFELLAAAQAALFLRIPIAHIHGGERTEGVIDEAIRHSLTKMALLHFPAAPEYASRIVRMGEDPSRVFCCGAPGLDHVWRTPPMTREELEASIGFSLKSPSALVTFHPETLEAGAAAHGAESLLAALDAARLRLLFTGTNSDPEGREISRRVRAFVRKNPAKSVFVESLGQRRYFSALRLVDLMIGNSSSGLIEAPSFGLPAVNIGDRQRGRLRGENVVDCKPSKVSILAAIRKALSPAFQARARRGKNPYDPRGDGKVSERIKNVIAAATLVNESLKKRFCD